VSKPHAKSWGFWLTSTSCKVVAEQVLRSAWRAIRLRAAAALLEEACAPALFSILVEGLADRFEPALCDAYVRLFSHAIEQTAGDLDAARSKRVISACGACAPSAWNDARLRAFAHYAGRRCGRNQRAAGRSQAPLPQCPHRLRGPHKNYELFAGDTRLEHAPVEYQRGSLRAGSPCGAN